MGKVVFTSIDNLEKIVSKLRQLECREYMNFDRVNHQRTMREIIRYVRHHPRITHMIRG